MTQTPLIPREILFGNPEKASPKLSPDGKFLAYLAPDDKNITRLWRRIQLATIAANIYRYLASTSAAVKIKLLTAKYKSRLNRLIKTRNLTK